MLKPRVRFLNYIHFPIYFHPFQWCITNECARLFFEVNSREGKLLDDDSKIWGWKEHSGSMELIYGQMFLSDYNFDHLERIFEDGEKLICMHFERKTSKKLDMPLFDPDVEDYEDFLYPF